MQVTGAVLTRRNNVGVQTLNLVVHCSDPDCHSSELLMMCLEVVLHEKISLFGRLTSFVGGYNVSQEVDFSSDHVLNK